MNKTNDKSHQKKRPSHLRKWLQESSNRVELYKYIKLILSIISIYIASTAGNINSLPLSATESAPNVKSIAIMDSTNLDAGIKFDNSGQGSVVIKNVETRGLDLNLIPNKSYNLQKQLGIDWDMFSVSPLQPGDVLKEDEQHWLLKSIDNTPEHSVATRNILQSMNMTLCYCSLDNKKCHLKTIGFKYKTKMQCA